MPGEPQPISVCSFVPRSHTLTLIDTCSYKPLLELLQKAGDYQEVLVTDSIMGIAPDSRHHIRWNRRRKYRECMGFSEIAVALHIYNPRGPRAMVVHVWQLPAKEARNASGRAYGIDEDATAGLH
jgi:hypothetical protein